MCTRKMKVKVLKPAVAATSSHLCTAAGNMLLLGDCADKEFELKCDNYDEYRDDQNAVQTLQDIGMDDVGQRLT